MLFTCTHYQDRVVLPQPYCVFQVCIFEVTGKAFLWHMIRCMMSVLFMVGEGKEDPRYACLLFYQPVACASQHNVFQTSLQILLSLSCSLSVLTVDSYFSSPVSLNICQTSMLALESLLTRSVRYIMNNQRTIQVIVKAWYFMFMLTICLRLQIHISWPAQHFCFFVTSQF